jgi:hypothetical protein
VIRNGLLCRLLQGAHHKIGYGPALNTRGALDQFFLTWRNPCFKTLIPLPRWCQ